MADSMTILDLPNEILSYLFKFLDTNDKVTISKTCKRFDAITTIPELVRNLNFTCSYSTSYTSLRSFFFVKIRCEAVQELNITSVYWLKAHEILIIVRKLVNLTSLYAADTALDLGSAGGLVSAAPQVKRLACSWNASLLQIDISNLEKWVASLEFLYINILSKPITVLCSLCQLFCCCDNLEELWLVWSVSANVKMSRHVSKHQDFTLPKLKKLITLVPTYQFFHYGYSYCTKLFKAVTSVPRVWLYYVANHRSPRGPLPRIIINAPQEPDINDFTNVECLYGSVIPMNLKKSYPSLKYLGYQLSPGRNDIPYLPNVTQLSLCQNLNPLNHCEINLQFPQNMKYFRLTDCACEHSNIISTLLNLRRLELTTCVLNICCEEIVDESDDESNTNKRIRYSPPSVEVKVPILKILTASCPNLQEFYLRKCVRRHDSSGSSLINFGNASRNLEYIKEWKHLERLTLDNICIPFGPYLEQITASCTKLTSLNLVNLDVQGMLRYRESLKKSLPKLKCLKDLRLEHSHIGKIDDLLRALTECPVIQRIAFIGRADFRDMNDVSATLNLIDKATNLVFLFFSCTDGTKRTCKTVLDAVRSKYSFTRPALTVIFSTPGHDSHDISGKVPAIHLTEMVLPHIYSPVAPFYRRRYISHYY